jgi:hypothetical protein
MRVKVGLYALLQATVCLLCAKAGFRVNAYELAASVISILSGGVLASICLEVAARVGLFRLSFALLGWLALAPMVWAIQSGIDAPFVWIREHAFWGRLVFMFSCRYSPIRP